MGRDPTELAELWKREPGRPVLIVDEVREHDAGAEFVTYCCIRIDGKTALELLAWVKSARSNMNAQSQNLKFKGALLFGSRKKAAHYPMQHYVFHALTQSQGVGLFVTSSNEIKAHKEKATGSLTLIAEPGDGNSGSVIGTELPFLQAFLKKVANDWKLGEIEVDAIIDRSARLGSDPNQRGIEPNSFEVWGPGKLNRLSDGTDSNAHCDTSFRFIMADDDGVTFRDLLLLPDALGYLGMKGGAFNAAIQQVKNGNPGWVYFADLPGLKQAAEKVLKKSRAAAGGSVE